MAQTFKAGDIVQLKSGGPKMTVDSEPSSSGVWCVWFAGAKHERAHFSVDSIVPAPEENQKA